MSAYGFLRPALLRSGTRKGPDGRVGQDLVYRDRESTLEIVSAGRPWSFDGDGSLFRLLSEAHRIRLAYLFDPRLAVSTSLVEPLPHQITAVKACFSWRREKMAAQCYGIFNQLYTILI
jgi:hypothetical protein